jgi:hypothetical protein
VGGGKGGEMAQTLYAHMNKRNFLKSPIQHTLLRLVQDLHKMF